MAVGFHCKPCPQTRSANKQRRRKKANNPKQGNLNTSCVISHDNIYWIPKASYNVIMLYNQGQSLSKISWWSPGRPSPKSWSSWLNTWSSWSFILGNVTRVLYAKTAFGYIVHSTVIIMQYFFLHYVYIHPQRYNFTICISNHWWP